MLLVEVLVRTVYVPGSLEKTYGHKAIPLRDRTNGRDLGVLFALAANREKTSLRIVLVGDSTVNANGTDQSIELPNLLKKELSTRAKAPVEILDFSLLGMYATDASVMFSRAFQLSPDLVVYSMSARAFPSSRQKVWETRLGDFAGTLSALSALPASYYTNALGAEGSARALVFSNFLTIALRRQLRYSLVESLGISDLLPGFLSPLRSHKRRGGNTVVERGQYMYELAKHHFPNDNTKALENIARQCDRHKGRCLVYLSPVNRDNHAGFQPGLQPAFEAFASRTARSSDLRLVSYSHVLDDPALFRRRLDGEPDSIHLTLDGRKVLADRLATTIANTLLNLRR